MTKKRNSTKVLTQEQAILRMKYAAPLLDFSKFVYTNYTTQSIVIHPTLGEIQISYINVIRSKGMERGQLRRKTHEDYLLELTEALKCTGDIDNYDLSKTHYVKSTQKVTITCKVHGDKEIAPFHLLNGRRCGECKGARISDTLKGDWGDIKDTVEVLHEDKYDYSKFIYVNNRTPGLIICKACKREFSMTIGNHLLRGQGCIVCNRSSKHVKFLEEGPLVFLSKAKLVHNNKYTYNNMIYTSSKETIFVTCNVIDKDGTTHGDFRVTPDAHLHALSGCPRCSNKISLAELQVRDFIKGLGLEVECNVVILGRHHIDIFIPSLMIGVEYCGVYWHGEKYRSIPYHKNKYLMAKEKGIQLIQIFEDEWLYNKDKVKSVLSTKLGKNNESIAARRTIFKEIPNDLAKGLYDGVHLQGGNTAIGKSFGLFLDDTLLSCMSFSTSNVEDGIADLARFASIGRITGGFSKLLKNAIPKLKLSGISTITSFSDNRWSDGRVYSSNGFSCVTKDSEIVPRYWWVHGTKRYHRRGFQRKNLRILFGETFKEEESEAENARRHGYHKIWDAGVTKWKLDI